jgi:hypothetical protein
MTDKIKFDVYKQERLQKCSMCDRVKQLVYKITIYDNESTDNIIASELQCCKICGDNLYNILNPGSNKNPNEFVKRTITFSK